MDPLIYQKVGTEKDKTYFLTSLTNRFDFVTDMFRKELEIRYGGLFEPIYIYQNYPAPKYEKNNYIVVNGKLGNKKSFIVGEEYEDLNIYLSNSRQFSFLIDNILTNQDKIFMVGFTNSFLNIDCDKIIYVGPKPKIATYFDNKLEQLKLFQKIGVSHPQFRFYDDINQLEKEKFPLYLTSCFSSGGIESGLINNYHEAKKFVSTWREYTKDKIIVTELIDGAEYFPNSVAIVDKEKAVSLIVSDQILSGNAYIGNIFPSKLSREVVSNIHKMTEKIGEHLRLQGYRGMFGCDFIVKGEEITVHDLNPRHQGGYLINNLQYIHNELVRAEISTSLDEVVLIERKKVTSAYFLAHIKVKLHDRKEHVLLSEVNINSENTPTTEIGKEYMTSFYKQGYKIQDTYPGYLIKSGNNYESLIDEIKKDAERHLNELVD
ncbi:MAG: ATP-grasp domain-containing protein [bacterium]